MRGFRFHRCARRVRGKSRCVHAVRFVSTLLVPTPPRDTGNRTSQHRGGRGVRVRVRARTCASVLVYIFPGGPISTTSLPNMETLPTGRWTGPGPPKPCPKRGRRGTFFPFHERPFASVNQVRRWGPDVSHGRAHAKVHSKVNLMVMACECNLHPRVSRRCSDQTAAALAVSIRCGPIRPSQDPATLSAR